MRRRKFRSDRDDSDKGAAPEVGGIKSGKTHTGWEESGAAGFVANESQDPASADLQTSSEEDGYEDEIR